MDIYEFATKIDTPLVVIFIPGGGVYGGRSDEGSYQCYFEGKKGIAEGIFRGRRGVDDVRGVSKTSKGAIADYVRQIRGQRLGFDLLSEVVDVPETLRV